MEKNSDTNYKIKVSFVNFAVEECTMTVTDEVTVARVKGYLMRDYRFIKQPSELVVYDPDNIQLDYKDEKTMKELNMHQKKKIGITYMLDKPYEIKVTFYNFNNTKRNLDVNDGITVAQLKEIIMDAYSYATTRGEILLYDPNYRTQMYSNEKTMKELNMRKKKNIGVTFVKLGVEQYKNADSTDIIDDVLEDTAGIIIEDEKLAKYGPTRGITGTKSKKKEQDCSIA
jgi:hypothetical protein